MSLQASSIEAARAYSNGGDFKDNLNDAARSDIIKRV
jgi:hypothetical protein